MLNRFKMCTGIHRGMAFVLCAVLSSSLAANQSKLPLVLDLLSQGFKQVNAELAKKQFADKQVRVIDLQTGSEYEIVMGFKGEKNLVRVAAGKPVDEGSAEAQSRTATLSEEYRLYLDKQGQLLSSDGTRSYTARLYSNGKEAYAARDIDKGRAVVKILLKPETGSETIKSEK